MTDTSLVGGGLRVFLGTFGIGSLSDYVLTVCDNAKESLSCISGARKNAFTMDLKTLQSFRAPKTSALTLFRRVWDQLRDHLKTFCW
jgi:hypothetical protein